MEYADSLWAHLGGDATDVSSQAEVDQWLEKMLDEAEEDNLDTAGVDDEPLAETTWNAAARHIQRREAIMRRTATGEPDWIEAARRIVANKQYEMVDGIMFDGFSASAVLQVWEAINDENKEKMAALGLVKAVNVAFKLMKSPAVSVSRKQANGGLTCPTCGEPVESTGTGWYRHVNGVGAGPCGIKLMDVAQRPDGTFTDMLGDFEGDDGEDDGYDSRYDSPDAWRTQSGQVGFSVSAKRDSVTPMSRKQAAPNTRKTAKSARDLAVGDVISGPGSGHSPTGTDSGTVAKVDSTTSPGTVYVYFGDHGPPADLIFNHGDPVSISEKESRKRAAGEKYRVVEDVGSPGKWVVQKWYSDNQLYHDVGDAVDSRQAAEEKLRKIQSEGSRRTAEDEKVHKAAPQDESLGVSTCRHCGNAVKRVPGGQGSTWVHTDTGAVAGSGGPRESSRTAATEGDMSTCRICGRALQYFDHAWYAIRLSRPKRDAPDHYHIAAGAPGRPGEFNADGTLNPGSPGGGGGQYDSPAGTIFDNGGNPIQVASRKQGGDVAVDTPEVEGDSGDEEDWYDDWIHDDAYDDKTDASVDWSWSTR